MRCDDAAGFTVGGTVEGLVSSGLRVQHGSTNATTIEASTAEFTLPEEFDDGTEYDVAITAQPSGQTCVITGSHGKVAGAHVRGVRVTCVDNPTDPLVGTYALRGGDGAVAYLTLFPDGVYVYGSVENDADCGPGDGNGVEYGVYSYTANTAVFRIVRTVVDTNGRCGVADGGASRFSGALERSGGGPNARLTLHVDGGGTVEFEAVESRSGQIIGSFAEASQKRVWVFTREDVEALPGRG